MFKEIYESLDEFIDDTDLMGTYPYLMSLPWITRNLVYFHSFFVEDGRAYRACFLSVRLIKYIKYRIFCNKIRRFLWPTDIRGSRTSIRDYWI